MGEREGTPHVIEGGFCIGLKEATRRRPKEGQGRKALVQSRTTKADGDTNGLDHIGGKNTREKGGKGSCFAGNKKLGPGEEPGLNSTGKAMSFGRNCNARRKRHWRRGSTLADGERFNIKKEDPFF